jgi:hypothetical protein
MGVTNGFLRLTRQEFSSLESDQSAFERRCRQYNDPDYLDMDKAGYELLFILNPSILDRNNPGASTPVPAISQVLGGGDVVHQSLDLGYGPAKRISDSSMRASSIEFEHLGFDQCYKMATTDLMSEVLMVETDEATFRQYHWPYLQSLGRFIKEAVERDMVVLRY